ncbi:MAG: MgtC/SapB family protein [Chloroflexi bacterium]|nr:MgtC/SapB family protein [Chloroflexota bacterium]
MLTSIISLEQQMLIVGQVLIAALLSMIIGIDREERDKSAGMRTHMLVGVGAALFTSLSLVAFPDSETARVAANVVTGVGFLGAGVIYKGEEKVHDLTTAASIWTTAAVGMAVGAGLWLLAAAATVLIWIILRLLWYVRRYI